MGKLLCDLLVATVNCHAAYFFFSFFLRLIASEIKLLASSTLFITSVFFYTSRNQVVACIKLSSYLFYFLFFFIAILAVD